MMHNNALKRNASGQSTCSFNYVSSDFRSCVCILHSQQSNVILFPFHLNQPTAHTHTQTPADWIAFMINDIY